MKKMNLNFAKKSQTVAMSGCPKIFQGDCGIMYRSY